MGVSPALHIRLLLIFTSVAFQYFPGEAGAHNCMLLKQYTLSQSHSRAAVRKTIDAGVVNTVYSLKKTVRYSGQENPARLPRHVHAGKIKYILC